MQAVQPHQRVAVPANADPPHVKDKTDEETIRVLAATGALMVTCGIRALGLRN
jgi:hypothetical protein